jgi:hypothetical protein
MKKESAASSELLSAKGEKEESANLFPLNGEIWNDYPDALQERMRSLSSPFPSILYSFFSSTSACLLKHHHRSPSFVEARKKVQSLLSWSRVRMIRQKVCSALHGERQSRYVSMFPHPISSRSTPCSSSRKRTRPALPALG